MRERKEVHKQAIKALEQRVVLAKLSLKGIQKRIQEFRFKEQHYKELIEELETSIVALKH